MYLTNCSDTVSTYPVSSVSASLAYCITKSLWPQGCDSIIMLKSVLPIKFNTKSETRPKTQR